MFYMRIDKNSKHDTLKQIYIQLNKINIQPHSHIHSLDIATPTCILQHSKTQSLFKNRH